MRYETILLAIDIEAENEAVIDYAFAFAEKAGATLHVLHASPVAVVSGDPESYASQRDHAHLALQKAVVRHRSSPSMGRTLVDMNEPIRAIVGTAVSISADLILVSTHARQGVRRVTIGSVASGVLEEANVPVLVLKNPPPAAT